jgi:ATP-dependent DNA ligase
MTVPANWALQKPQQQMDPKLFDRLNAEGHLTNMRKYNGFRAHVLTSAAGTRIWSRNWSIDYTPMFPHLAASFDGQPEGLVVDAELYVHGIDTTGAIQAAINGNGGDQQARLAVFDLLDLQGQLAPMAQDRRFQLVEAMTGRLGPNVHRAQVCEAATYVAMEQLIETMDWEGVVSWDRRAGHKLNTNGNVKRGDSWKIKRTVTEDLVVLKVVGGAGPDMIGAVFHLARKVGGVLVPAGKVGSWSKELDLNWVRTRGSDFVVEVRHFGVDESTGFMEFPKILRGRPDLDRDFSIAA